MATVEVGGQEVKVLFYLPSTKEDGAKMAFIELKRPAFKGNDNFSKYCCWFQVVLVDEQPKQVVALSFKSWDKEADKRFFDQGMLEVGAGRWTSGSTTTLSSKAPEELPQEVLHFIVEQWDSALQ